MVEAIRDSQFHWPDCELVAVEEDGAGEEVVGHVMISGTTLQHLLGERTIAMLSPLAVRPDRQRRGIGELLVRSALDAARTRGEPLVVVEGSPDYYGRRGFGSASAVGISLPIPDWAPPEAAQVALLTDRPGDSRTWRGRVRYPPAVAAASH